MKNFFDKYGKDLNCSECPHLTLCLDKKEPQCASGYMQFQDNKIKDLEAKLAESEEQVWALENQKLHAHNCLNKLKQQLAEKEKLIEFYINSGKEQCDEINKLNSRILNYCDEIDKGNQDKISFAVEQFEQIFSDFNKKVYDEFGDNDVKYITLDIEDVNFYLQDKIKSIKEGK